MLYYNEEEEGKFHQRNMFKRKTEGIRGHSI